MCELGSKSTLVFLVADGEASYLLLPSLFSIIPGGTVQPENTYSCILKVTGHVENRERWAAKLIFVVKHLPYRLFIVTPSLEG